MAQATGTEEYCGIEVLICGCACSYAFPGVEEEWNIEGLGDALRLEVEEFGRERGKGATGIFVAYEVVA